MAILSSGRCVLTLQWHHNEHDGISNHQPHDCLLNRLFRHRSKKPSTLRVTGLCEGNSPADTTDRWPQRASNAEKCFHFMTSSWDVAAHVEFIVDITIELASDEFYICCIFGDGDFGTWALSVCHLWRWETNSLCCAIYVRGWRVGTFF